MSFEKDGMNWIEEGCVIFSNEGHCVRGTLEKAINFWGELFPQMINTTIEMENLGLIREEVGNGDCIKRQKRPRCR